MTKKKLNNKMGLQNKSEIIIVKYDFEKSYLIININLVILVYGQNTLFQKHKKKRALKLKMTILQGPIPTKYGLKVAGGRSGF